MTHRTLTVAAVCLTGLGPRRYDALQEPEFAQSDAEGSTQMAQSDGHDQADRPRTGRATASRVLRLAMVAWLGALVGCQVAERVVHAERKPGAYNLAELLKGNPTTYDEMLEEAKDLRSTAYVIQHFPTADPAEARRRQADAAKILDRAEHWTRQAIALKPNQADAYHLLGNCLAQQQKHAAAITAYEDAVRRDAKLAKSHYCMGVVAFEQADALAGDAQTRQYAEAQKHWSQALKVDPRFYRAEYNLGVIVHRQGRWDEAKTHYQKALTIQPAHANAKLNLGLILVMHESNLDGAIKLWKEIVADRPDHIRAQYNLARAAIEHKAYDEAEQHWLAAYRGTPADAAEQALRAEACYRLAILYEDIQKDLAKCNDAILNACKFEPRNKDYRHFLRRVERKRMMQMP